VVFVIISIPLILRVVPPNGIYGFRIAATQASRAISRMRSSQLERQAIVLELLELGINHGGRIPASGVAWLNRGGGQSGQKRRRRERLGTGLPDQR
jgi:hypothetical protein